MCIYRKYLCVIYIYIYGYIYMKQTASVMFCVSACSDFNQKQDETKQKTSQNKNWALNPIMNHMS